MPPPVVTEEEEMEPMSEVASSSLWRPTVRLQEKTSPGECPASIEVPKGGEKRRAPEGVEELERLEKEGSEQDQMEVDATNPVPETLLQILETEVWDQEDDAQRFVEDLGCWCLMSDIEKADSKELDGLYDAYDMFDPVEWSDIPKTSRVVDTRMVRVWKGDVIKSRLVARDIKRSPVEGG